MNGNRINIDVVCMSRAQLAINGLQLCGKKEAEKAVIEALALLQENGLYAMFIYLKSNYADKPDGNNNAANNNEEKPNKKVYRVLVENMDKCGKDILVWNDGGDVLKKAQIVSQDIFKLLFTVDCFRQTLVYIRYLVKGLPDKSSRQKSEKQMPEEPPQVEGEGK